MTSPHLAHYGGAPEALTIVLPILVIAGLVVMERRIRRREWEAADAEGPDLGPDPDGQGS